MLNVVMLNVIMVSVVMLSVATCTTSDIWLFSGSTLVEHSTHFPKIKGLILATRIGFNGVRMLQDVVTLSDAVECC